MNNYEYINIPNSYPNNYENDDRINYIPNMNNYDIQFLTKNMLPNNNQDNKILEPYQGFIRGNIFQNQYEQYKNYKPLEINSKNERENLLNQLQQYTFALIELNLHLDVYPNDNNALKLYNNYQDIKKQLLNKYENMYGPLTLDSNDLNKNTWVWINSPWPWEEI